MQTNTINFAGDVRFPGDASVITPINAQPQHKEENTTGSTQELEVAKLRTELSNHGITLKFSRDEATNDLVVQMIDDKTGDEIRQFPTEVSLSLAANFMKLRGVFLDVEK